MTATPGSRANPGRIAWLGVCLLLGVPALCLAPVPLDLPLSHWSASTRALVWQPDQGFAQPIWAAWSAAWLHGSPHHRDMNLLGLLLLALMGWLTASTRGAPLAWLVAWPLTQLGLLLQPDPISRYVGLSGVLHAGLTVVCLHGLTADRPPFARWAAAVLLLGTAGRLIMENPFAHRLVQPSGSDITVVPWVHLSGVVAGLVGSLITWLAHRGMSKKT